MFKPQSGTQCTQVAASDENAQATKEQAQTAANDGANNATPDQENSILVNN